MGTQPEVTTVTEKIVANNVEEDQEQMASIGIATIHDNAYNVSKMKGEVDKYKDKMAKIKETLRKEQGVGPETKRKCDATLSYLERLQEAYHILEI